MNQQETRLARTVLSTSLKSALTLKDTRRAMRDLQNENLLVRQKSEEPTALLTMMGTAFSRNMTSLKKNTQHKQAIVSMVVDPSRMQHGDGRKLAAACGVSPAYVSNLVSACKTTVPTKKKAARNDRLRQQLTTLFGPAMKSGVTRDRVGDLLRVHVEEYFKHVSTLESGDGDERRRKLEGHKYIVNAHFFAAAPEIAWNISKSDQWKNGKWNEGHPWVKYVKAIETQGEQDEDTYEKRKKGYLQKYKTQQQKNVDAKNRDILKKKKDAKNEGAVERKIFSKGIVKLPKITDEYTPATFDLNNNALMCENTFWKIIAESGMRYTFIFGKTRCPICDGGNPEEKLTKLTADLLTAKAAYSTASLELKRLTTEYEDPALSTLEAVFVRAYEEEKATAKLLADLTTASAKTKKDLVKYKRHKEQLRVMRAKVCPFSAVRICENRIHRTLIPLLLR